MVHSIARLTSDTDSAEVYISSSSSSSTIEHCVIFELPMDIRDAASCILGKHRLCQHQAIDTMHLTCHDDVMSCRDHLACKLCALISAICLGLGLGVDI